MHKLLRDVVLLLLWAPSGQSYDKPLQDVAFSSLSQLANTATLKALETSGGSTCSSRTVNYITHTLVQQCLRTDHASANLTKTDIENSSSDTNAIFTSSSITTTTEKPINDATVATANADETKGPTQNTRQAKDAETPDGSHSSTPSVTTDSTSSVDPSVEIENDSPLDTANFLSFEDWKRQNLARVGQSPDNVGRTQSIGTARQRPGIENMLDTFGDENEISLDFSGFGPGAPSSESTNLKSVSTVSTEIGAVDQPPPGSLESRSKDAGKTCKERTNYASFDCAASVLKANSECKSASSVLVENKDTYVLNKCSAKNKYFVVELCDDILIDTVVLANYEFFSSSFRHFRVSVSDRYPVKEEKWRELGTYEARNTREIQAFLVQNPLIWARYLRIEFLTHYGSEYYCPVSLLRVHGTTMIQEYLHHEESTRDDQAEEDITLVGEVVPAPPVPSNVPEPVGSLQQAEIQIGIDGSIGKHDAIIMSQHTPVVPNIDSGDPSATKVGTAASSSTNAAVKSRSEHEASKHSQETILSSNVTSQLPSTQSQNENAAVSPKPSTVQVASSGSSRSSQESVETTAMPSSKTETRITLDTQSSPHSAQQLLQPSKSTMNTTMDAAIGVATSSTVTTPIVSQSTIGQSATSSSISRVGPVASTGPQSAQPPTQESFFKSVHKRLQQLESNSTLSLQYIEDQSRILRDAFSKVEKRQVSIATTFLTNLNQTVMNDLRGFRQAYDQLWQSTVIELEGQREQFQGEMLALSTRLKLVADELVWQKRLWIVQSTLVLMCLVLVLFGRSGNGSLEFPIMQQMMNRSTAALRTGWESPPNSPSPLGRSPARLFRPKLWRSNTEPNHLTDSEPSRPQSMDSPDLVIDPSALSTPDTRSDVDEQEDVAPLAAVAGAGQSSSPSQVKKRRKRRQSASSRNRKAKSPLGYS